MKNISLFTAKILTIALLMVAVAPVITAGFMMFDANAQDAPPSGNGSGDTSIGAQRASSEQVNDNTLVTTMCNVLRLVTGNAGKAFAAFAIISVGIGFFTGKVSWGLMIGVAAGIAAMFGAPTIVGAITGNSSFDCSAN